MEAIETFLKDLVSSFQAAKIYTIGHPNFTVSLTKAFEDLRRLLENRAELTVGIVGRELTTSEEIFFDLSEKAKDFIGYLKSRGIERITFLKGVTKDELIRFVSCVYGLHEENLAELDKRLTASAVKNITVGKIKVSSPRSVKELKESVSYLKLYEDSLGDVSQALTNVLNARVIDGEGLKATVSNLMENLLGKYHDFLKLSSVKKYDIGTFIHLLNVSILSMYFSSKLGFAKDIVHDIGVAALFHDIGKIYISRKIIGKPGRLTDEEFSKIKSHTVLGAEILLEYTATLGILPVVVSFEHHLRYDLRGYPKLPFRQNVHLASLIISLCDVYDALNQRRSYKQEYPPKMIYDLMTREKGGYFEPVLLEEFFKIMGVWPLGTIVRLNNGRIAVVREENRDDIFSPKVEVVSPEREKKFVDLGKTKEIKIEHFVNPLGEGRKYLSLI